MWTDERTDLLIKLWIEDGLTASECARAIGHGVTRNAIIGKVHRLKLKPRKSTRRSTKPARIPKPRKYLSTRRRVERKMPLTDMPKVKVEKIVPKSPDQPAWQALPGTSPVTLMGINVGMCKWPIGDGSPFLFCGCTATNGHYCLEHYRWSIGTGTRGEQKAAKDARLAVHFERKPMEMAA